MPASSPSPHGGDGQDGTVMDNPAHMPDGPEIPLGLLRQAGPELASALGLLRRLFDVRVTFFDLGGVEADGFEVKPISAYCATRRRDPAFNARCLACDRRHLDEAKLGRRIRIYRCHDGLVEGVIPLYGRDGAYLGAIMFGQLRPGDDPSGGRSAAWQRLRERLPQADDVRLADLAELLKWLTEHLAANAALRAPQLPWAEAVRRHLAAHLGDKLTLAGVARAVGRSPSFLSHRFPATFGTSFARHVRDLRLAAARSRLAQGASLRLVADELGFCDRYHLSRAYSAHFGHPPRGSVAKL
jgi:AraC-like DNA-binding protein